MGKHPKVRETVFGPYDHWGVERRKKAKKQKGSLGTGNTMWVEQAREFQAPVCRILVWGKKKRCRGKGPRGKERHFRQRQMFREGSRGAPPPNARKDRGFWKPARTKKGIRVPKSRFHQQLQIRLRQWEVRVSKDWGGGVL